MHALIALALLAAAAPNDVAAASIERLSWMAGGWASRDGEEWTEEHWLAPRGGTMLGLHRDVRGRRTTGFEFLRIEARPEGLVYLASPGGRPATTFRAIEVSHERVVFENKEHDFPQRILYWRSPGALHARIEGVENGKPASMEWRWRALVR
ncbi:MAG TPA: DUF6265 family protein [Vicinamibacteria bacterium]